MAPVTVASSSVVAGGSGSTGWSARALFRPDVVVYSTTTALSASIILNGGASGSNSKMAQSFTLSSGQTIDRVNAFLARQGSPTDSVFIELHTDGGGAPSGTVLATSDSIDAALLAGSVQQGVDFVFPSPPTVTGSTKYWVVFHRTGARDTGDGFYLYNQTSGASGYSTFNTSWSTESGSAALALSIPRPVASPSLYAVVQDSSLHVMESTDDGSTWSEVDSSNAPAVTNSTYPFSVSHNRGFNENMVAYFSATNTVRFRRFNVLTGVWNGDFGSQNMHTGIANTRAIRMVATTGSPTTRPSGVGSTSADDTDIALFRSLNGGAPTTSTILGATSTDSSLISETVNDSGEQVYSFYYDAQNQDFTVVSNINANVSSHIDIDATAATSHAGHTSNTYEPYDVGGVNRVTAAYIDADDTINERTVSMGVVSASATLGTQRQVTTSTAYAGGKLSTCAYGGNRYVFASKADGTSIDYWVSTDDTTSNTWGTVNNVTTGTGLHLAQALPVAGTGILLIYQDGSNVVVDWAVDGPGGGAVDATGTISVGTVTASGQTVTGTGTVSAAGTVSVGTVSATGQSVTGIAGTGDTATISQGTVAATGQAVSASYGVSASATVNQGTATATGQSVSASFTVSATGTVSPGTITATGQAVTATATVSDSATISAGTIDASGEAIAATYGVAASAAVSVGTIAATGESITGTFGVSVAATVSPGTVAATGESVTANAGGAATGAVSAGTVAATGQNVTGTAGVSVSAAVSQGAIAASGEMVTALAGQSITGTVSVGTVAASGETVTASSGISATATVTEGTVTASGQSVAGSFTVSATGTVTAGTIAATGEIVTASFSLAVGDMTMEGRISVTPYLTGRIVVEPYLSGDLEITPYLTGRLEIT